MEQAYHITLSRDHVNQTICFELMEDCRNIEFELMLNEKFRFKSYIVVTDPANIIRLQRLLGHGELRYIIGDSPMNTSAGGYPGPLPKGRWTFQFYCMYENFDELFKTKESIALQIRCNTKCAAPDYIGSELWTDYSSEHHKITLSRYNETKILSDKSKWYGGDFHTHTRLSDGSASSQKAMEIANNQKLDFYVTTEHNVIHTGFVATDVLAIPGIEITTEYGHLNCFGIKELPDYMEDIFKNAEDKNKTEAAVLTIMKENRRKGSINSINHPFLYPWSWEFLQTPLDLVDTIEIENDPTYNGAAASNEKALKLLDFLWADGHKIYAVGGSDSHNLPDVLYEGSTLPSIIGDPRTGVYSAGLSSKAILENVIMGHTCVSRFIEIEPSITLLFDDGRTEDYLPGDRLSGECTSKPFTLQYKLCFGNVKEELTCRLIVNGAVGKELKVGIKETEAVITCKVEAASYLWIRMDIRNKWEEFIGYINPVYAGAKESNYQNYQQALSAFIKQN